MEKKKWLFISILATSLLLAGCGDSSEEVKITDIEGNTSEMAMNDFKSEVKGNTASFNDKYTTGTITFTDKIKSIEDTSGINFGGITCGEYGRKYYKKTAVIYFETDGIILYVNKEKDNVELDKLKSGDKVEVTTNISNANIYANKLYVSLASYSGINCEFGSKPTIVIKK